MHFKVIISLESINWRGKKTRARVRTHPQHSSSKFWILSVRVLTLTLALDEFSCFWNYSTQSTIVLLSRSSVSGMHGTNVYSPFYCAHTIKRFRWFMFAEINKFHRGTSAICEWSRKITAKIQNDKNEK